MSDCTVYHGAPYDAGKALLRGKSAIRFPHPSKKELFDGPNTSRFGSIGSLGYGFYSFLEDADMARYFAQKFAHDGGVLVLEIRVRLDSNTTLRFDSSVEDIKRFHAFLNDPKRSRDVRHLINTYSNSSFQKSLDGALIELYCALMKEGDIADINAICSPTTSNVGNVIPDAQVPNGIEVLIKDRKVIMDDKFKVVHNQAKS
ncbi:MAG: hypothetical protein LKJ01_08680 [Lactobacillus sp.]|nr:hypothetical protein [Lactobacillus sp.]MCI2017308.1 hypothetical protein [Lactobacillus sp.]MCI2037220.1 hypothetical protein [Lactobacillus sp.]